MTTTSGPIPLTVVTLWCRTAEAVCENWRPSGKWGRCNAEERSGVIYALSANTECKAPPWCPLAAKETT